MPVYLIKQFNFRFLFGILKKNQTPDHVTDILLLIFLLKQIQIAFKRSKIRYQVLKINKVLS